MHIEENASNTSRRGINNKHESVDIRLVIINCTNVAWIDWNSKQKTSPLFVICGVPTS